MSFVDRVRACREFDPGRYVPFRVDGVRVGLIERGFAGRLAPYRAVFAVGDAAVDLSSDLTDAETRTDAVEGVLRDLADTGALRGWRGERYPVTTAFGRPLLFLMERAAVPKFGVRAHGVHINGFVRDGSDIRMWIGRRSDDRLVEPGKLDQIVAGGQPAGLTLAANLRKEADEEAAIPPALADRAVPVGAITYLTEQAAGLRNDVLFLYDLELPRDFEPVNRDGEIASFKLMPLDEVAALARDGDAFKFNCSLVVIDFLIRHGRLDPAEPDYLEIVEGLRSGLPPGPEPLASAPIFR